jgi:L-amino acid N-acyltransferase YncA
MTIRHAVATDLPAVVEIYNASIPGRMATADTSPVSVQQREEWFRGFDPASRPLWVLEEEGRVAGWLGLRP